MSLTPDDQRERAAAMPAGPAPTTRAVVLDGKDWDIVEGVLTGRGGRKRMFKYVGMGQQTVDY